MASTNQRSLWNYNAQQAASQPGLYLQSILKLFQSVSDVKTLRNIALSGASTINDTVIGATTPSSGRFTSFSAGLLNADIESVFNGPNNSQLVWKSGVLKFINAGISTSNLLLDANSRVSWGGDSGAYLRHNGDNNIVLSDPIVSIGDNASSETSDMGIMMANHHFFGLRAASPRVSTLTRDNFSFQVLGAPMSVLNNKSISSEKANTSIEIEWMFARRLRHSFEILTVSDTNVLGLDVQLHTSKIYGMRTSAVTSYQVSLDIGDDNGHVKVIQYLPQVAISGVQASSDPTLTSTTPALKINGMFCLPPYGLLQDNITLNGFGISVTLQYDAVLKAWIVACNGAF